MKLIVIDMQKALMDDELYNLNGLIENIVKILKTARENQLEQIWNFGAKNRTLKPDF